VSRIARFGLVSLVAWALVMTTVALTPSQPPSKLEVVSPNGKYRISLDAIDSGAFLVVAGEPGGSTVQLSNTPDQRSTVGVWGPGDGGGWRSMSACLSADPQTGFVQLVHRPTQDIYQLTPKTIDRLEDRLDRKSSGKSR
jgi:hypothetical protein